MIYVTDASRSVGVCQSLMSKGRRDELVAEVEADYATVRERRSRGRSNRPIRPLSVAQQHALAWDWENYQPPAPAFLGLQPIRADIEALVPYIDWTPFFRTWELAGRFPAILEDDVVGASARDLYRDAKQTLDEIVAEKLVEARGVIGFWAANRDAAGDIIVWRDEARDSRAATLHHLRQQSAAAETNLALSDYVGSLPVSDYVGGFAVSVASDQPATEDDYRDIMLKALSDRLVEAFAEWLHERVRKELWGYDPNESLNAEALIGERYRGIRPAPGYPACPDHSEKTTLFRMLDATEHTGATLTENYAMWPASTVAGWYFSHPAAKYFGVGTIGPDQLADYARRKGTTPDEAGRWLSFSRPD